MKRPFIKRGSSDYIKGPPNSTYKGYIFKILAGYRQVKEGEIIKTGDLFPYPIAVDENNYTWTLTEYAGSVNRNGWIYIRKIE